MDKNKALNSKHFCMMPWVHMHIWPAGTTYPCCLGKVEMPVGNTQTQSLADIWNGPQMRGLRTNMLADQPSPQCVRCYELEESNIWTLRNNSLKFANNHWDQVESTKVDGTVDEVRLAYLDIRFSNICNLRCRSCGPQFSSSWFEDHKKLHGDPKHSKILSIREDMDSLFEEMKPFILQTEEVYFAGGEPLITEEHYKILELWEAHGKYDVNISYTTNFTNLTYKKRHTFDYWQKFPNIRVAASLDAMGARGEFLRKGTNWSTVVENRKAMKEVLPDIYFEITPTVSLYNVWHLPDFHREWVEEGLIEVDSIRANLLLDPQRMRCQVLSPKFKAKVTDKYIQHIEWIRKWKPNAKQSINDMNSIIDFMNKEDYSNMWNNFLRHDAQLDTLRNEKLFDVFPELKENDEIK